MKTMALVVGGLAGFACSIQPAAAQEGYPDSTFGNAGTGFTTFASSAYAYPRDTAVLPDGKILVLSSIQQNDQTTKTTSASHASPPMARSTTVSASTARCLPISAATTSTTKRTR